MEHSLANVDQKTVSDFGDEWDCFDQSELKQKEVEILFQKYFSIFLWENSKMPFQFKKILCFLIALFIYFPLSRSAKFFESCGGNIENWPLAFYRNSSFYVLKTDALDRFGTKLEKRFTKEEIFLTLQEAGLKDVEFSEEAPYWCAVGYKA